MLSHLLRCTPKMAPLPVCLCLMITALLPLAIQAAPFERPTIPAQGEQQSLVNITQFGRYSITVASEQGTALQLVDHMVGPGDISGSAGVRDGRLDLFLDQGQYKLLTFAHPQGEGVASLALHPFTELNVAPLSRLVENRLVSDQLGDFQQRSYWLDIKTRQTILLEAAGRSLADLRLWRDGNWLVDSKPVHEDLTPTPGQPLNGLNMVATLEPGLYLLSAYGGVATEWAESSAAQPFYLRMGIPRLGSAGRQLYNASPFGRDRWLVPAGANYYRLELPQAETATIEISRYTDEQPLSGYRQAAGAIDKKSLPPVAELNTGSPARNWQLITIKREAGKPYVLQHFNSAETHSLSSAGRYLVSTIQSGHGEDAADATALVVSRPRRGPAAFHWADTIELNKNTGWQRRFNLLGENTLYLEVKESTNYTLETEGVEAELRLEPFLLNRPQGYETPPYRSGRWQQNLDRGFYTLTLRPGSASRSRGKGIVTLGIGATGRKPKPAPAQTSVNFPPLILSQGDRYTVYSNRRDGITSGLVVRPLPLDMREPLPVTLAVGEAIELPLNIPDSGSLQVITEDGQHLLFQVDKQQPAERFTLAAGSYHARLENNGDSARSYSLQWLPANLASDTPLPSISPQALAARPEFPQLKTNIARFMKVLREQSNTLNVSVEQPGLYHLESTGLLHTEGTLRTRVITSLAHEKGNGIGRNFLIDSYLREGDYQLTFQPQGRSKGEIGLRLSPATLHNGGTLEAGVVARHSLQAGEGLIYHFAISEEGDYRLRALDLHSNARFRLEDAEGWPLLRPGTAHDITHHLKAGSYRLVILPQTVEARVITRLDAVQKPEPFSGHGPHRISSQERLTHTWYEPKGGVTREADRWQFTLPTEATLHMELSEGMVGKLHANGFEPKTLYGNKPWQGKLPGGQYELAVTSLRPDNGRDYTLTLRPEELLLGITRQLSAPGEYTVAIGDEQPFELASFGNQDVRATLFDQQGERLASNDDRPNDWNFLIATRLAHGNYRLQIEPVGTIQATTEVTLHTPQQRLEKAVTLPASFSISDTLMHYYPLLPGNKGGLLLFSAQGADSVGLALERREGERWHNLGSHSGTEVLLSAPVPKEAGTEYRLRVWSVSGRSLPISVNGLLLEADSEDEGELADGLAMKRVDGLALAVGVASVAIEERGSLRLDHRDPLLEWGSGFATALTNNGRDTIDAEKGVLWLVRPLTTKEEVNVHAERLQIGPGEELALVVAPTRPSSMNLAAIPLLRGNSQLLIASSTVGQPGMRLEGVNSSPYYSASDQQSVLLRHDNSTPLVEILGDAALPNPIPVRLSVHTFTSETALDAHSGDNDLTLTSQGILEIQLPKSETVEELALPAGVVAELLKDGDTVHTLWSGRQPRSFQLTFDIDTVRLYNPHTTPLQAALSVRPSRGSTVLTSRQPSSRRFSGAGVWVVPVTLSETERHEGRLLQLRGTQNGALAVQQDGTIRQGETLLLSDDAVLYIHHTSGVVVAWLESKNGTTGLQPQQTVVANLGRNPLSGTSRGLRYQAKAPGGVTLNGNETVLVQVRNKNSQEWLSLQPQGASMSLYLPAGDNLIGIYAVDNTLTGDIYLQQPPLESLHEGLGQPALLAPGGSRLYRFNLDKSSTIGLGVSATVDTVNSVLLDAGGTVLGEGLVQMHDLQMGDYLLRVEAPADGQTVTIRPVLIGTEVPTDGAPPADVVRSYMEQAGIKTKE